jgi:hypothetical protein
LKRTTANLLARLDEIEWFAAVGDPLPDTVVTVSSWDDAFRCCSSLEWGDFTLEQRNRLTMHLHVHARARYQGWNECVQSIKEVLEPIGERKIPPGHRGLAAEAEKAVRDAALWDLLGACTELEYADVREPGFFCGLVAWYLRGRFPCGWGDRNSAGELQLFGPVDEGEYDPNESDWLKLVLANQERLFRPRVRLPMGGKLIVY